MSEVLQYLTDEQKLFLKSELGFDEQALSSMNDDELYDKVYDPLCVIEEVETVAAEMNVRALSDRGRIAADIVTTLGNALD